VHFKDGVELHFCTQACMKACFDACCVHGGAQGYLVTARWPGALSGATFPTKIQAVDALVALLPQPGGSRPEWEGKPLYPNKAKTRTDPLYPRLANFPSPAPAGAFLAHYDAAGGGRPYGPHPGSKLSNKLQAAYDVIAKMKDRGKQGGSKAVVFSESVRALSVLRDFVASAHGEEAVALIDGAMVQERRADEIKRFTTDPACYVLFLTVGACAAGLTLTAADHCLLLEPQPNAGPELQLVDRVSLYL
jgi:SNF2 family DNA or RNA helicase